MSNALVDYSSMLLSKDNPEVVREFEKSYIEAQYRYFLALKVPVQDITTYFHKAQITGANPILQEIFLIPRNVKVKRNGREEYETVGTIVFNYNFIRRKAQGSKEYQGMKIETKVDKYFDPIDCKEKDMLRATATCKRNGSEYSYTAWWNEYVQTNSYGVNAQWKSKPYVMLGKCAEAGVLRMAFPEWLSGAYAQEELGAVEKDDSAIEAQFSIQGEAEKTLEIQDRIDDKIAQSESMEKVEALVEGLKHEMATLTQGLDLGAKGKAMSEHLGVRKFDELKKKPVDELEILLSKVKAVNSEKTLRDSAAAQTSARATKTTKPSFILEE